MTEKGKELENRKHNTSFNKQLFSVDSLRGTRFYLTGVSIVRLLNPMKHPRSVKGTFKLNQSTTSTRTSEIGTIAARFVSMYSHTSITKRDPARKRGKNELERRVRSIQLVPLKNL